MWSGSEKRVPAEAVEKKTPEVIAAIEELMKRDPVSLRWTRDHEKNSCHSRPWAFASGKTVAKLLKQMNFSLRDQQKEDLEWLPSNSRRPVRQHHTATGALADVATPY